MAYFNEALTVGITNFGEAAISGNVRQSKNYIMNGNFDFWQRGTSFSATTLASSGFYTADRWRGWRSSSAQAFAVSQITSLSINGAQFGIRCGRDSGSALTTQYGLQQAMPNFETLAVIGKYLCMSVYLRAGADYSQAASGLGVELFYGTGTNQPGLPAAVTGSVSLGNRTATLTTSFQRFTFVWGPVPSAATQLFFDFNSQPVGTAGAADYFDVAQMMLSQGQQPAPFEYYAGSYGSEFYECQRFYEKTFAVATTPAQSVSANRMGISQVKAASTAMNIWVPYKVRKRAAPIITLFNPNNTNAQIRNLITSTDFTATTASTVVDTGFDLNGTPPVSTNVGDICSIHWTADAEL